MRAKFTQPKVVYAIQLVLLNIEGLFVEFVVTSLW